MKTCFLFLKSRERKERRKKGCQTNFNSFPFALILTMFNEIGGVLRPLLSEKIEKKKKKFRENFSAYLKRASPVEPRCLRKKFSRYYTEKFGIFLVRERWSHITTDLSGYVAFLTVNIVNFLLGLVHGSIISTVAWLIGSQLSSNPWYFEWHKRIIKLNNKLRILQIR